MRKGCGRELVASAPSGIRWFACRTGATLSCEPGRMAFNESGRLIPGRGPIAERRRGEGMSLIRQVWLLLSLTLALAFVGATAVSVHFARNYLQTQLSLKNNDTAQAIALSLSRQ